MHTSLLQAVCWSLPGDSGTSWEREAGKAQLYPRASGSQVVSRAGSADVAGSNIARDLTQQWLKYSFAIDIPVLLPSQV